MKAKLIKLLLMDRVSGKIRYIPKNHQIGINTVGIITR